MLLTRVEQLLSAWRGEGDYKALNGSLLVCRWPSEGPLAYLHELYQPITPAGAVLLRERFRYEVPASYGAFLSEHNGARLFLGSISLSGVINEVSRSASIDYAQPISVLDDLDLFAAISRGRWNAGWRRIGEVVVNRRWNIEVGEKGAIAITTEQKQLCLFEDIWGFLSASTAMIASSFSTDGQQLDSWDELDLRLGLWLQKRN